jgi:CBS domain-containing protein
MTPASEITTLRPTDSFTDAYRLFLKPNVRRIPVTSDNGQLVGLLSRGTIIRIFVEAYYGHSITPR